jgi:ribosomal protein L44E
MKYKKGKRHVIGKAGKRRHKRNKEKTSQIQIKPERKLVKHVRGRLMHLHCIACTDADPSER